MLKHSIYCRACSLVSFFGLLCHSTLVSGIFYFIYIKYYLIGVCINACVCASVHFRLSRYVHINVYLHGHILWNLQARGNEMGKKLSVHGWTRGTMTWNVNYEVQRVHIQLNALTTKIIVRTGSRRWKRESEERETFCASNVHVCEGMEYWFNWSHSWEHDKTSILSYT